MGSRAEHQVFDLADEQWGLISRAQAMHSGMSLATVERRLDHGRWQAVQPGVYRLPGTGRPWEQRVFAACLATDGVASHRSAAALWDLGFSRGEIVEIAVPRSNHPRLRNVVVHRATDLEKANVVSRRGIPVTDPARTIVDLGAVVPDFIVDRAIDAAVGRKLLTVAALETQLPLLSRKGRRGVGVLRRCLERRGIFFGDSDLEQLFDRVVRRHDLPPAVHHHVIRDGGRFVAEVDFAYPIARLAIEIDGYEPHSSFDAFQRDRARQNEIIELGWRVLRFTRDDLRDRDVMVASHVLRMIGADLTAERARAA